MLAALLAIISGIILGWLSVLVHSTLKRYWLRNWYKTQTMLQHLRTLSLLPNDQERERCLRAAGLHFSKCGLLLLALTMGVMILVLWPLALTAFSWVDWLIQLLVIGVSWRLVSLRYTEPSQ